MFCVVGRITIVIPLSTSCQPHERQQNDEFTMAFVCQQKQQSETGGKGWRRKRQSEKLRTCAHKSFTLATMFCNARCLSCFMSHHLRLGYYIAECCVLCVVMLLYDFSYCFTLFWMKQEKKVKKRFSVCLSAFTQYLIIKCLFVVHHSCVYIKFSTDCYRRTFVHRKINKRSNK